MNTGSRYAQPIIAVFIYLLSYLGEWPFYLANILSWTFVGAIEARIYARSALLNPESV